MALVICCPCGNPIDFEHLELVVTLTCPHCKRELDLELENGPVNRRRAVLTVMAGPHWVGERFLMPVGVDLSVGQASGNWISLEDDAVAQIHCRLRLQQDGSVIVEDRQSPTGTWIGNQRIARGKLAPKQSLRIGNFRLRLDYQAVDGSTIVAAPTSSVSDTSGLLPTMAKVRPRNTPANWLITNRFPFCRTLMLVAAWTLGVYHALALHNAQSMGWRWPVAIAGGLVIVGLFVIAGRQVALAHRQFRFAPLGLFALLAILDLAWGALLPAVVSIGFAACLSIMIIQTPGAALATVGGLTGVLAAIVLAIATIRDLWALVA
jgi:hypothetical protein